MPTPTVRALWTGTLLTGSGYVELDSLKPSRVELTYFTRRSYTAGADTFDETLSTASPDELIAAAYAASLTMELVADLTEADATPKNIEVRAAVSYTSNGPDKSLTGISLAVQGDVGGIGSARFATAVRSAQASCPIGVALAGIEITLDAVLKGPAGEAWDNVWRESQTEP